MGCSRPGRERYLNGQACIKAYPLSVPADRLSGKAVLADCCSCMGGQLELSLATYEMQQGEQGGLRQLAATGKVLPLYLRGI